MDLAHGALCVTCGHRFRVNRTIFRSLRYATPDEPFVTAADLHDYMCHFPMTKAQAWICSIALVLGLVVSAWLALLGGHWLYRLYGFVWIPILYFGWWLGHWIYKVRGEAPEGEIERVVSIPPPDEELDDVALGTTAGAEGPTHTEIQWRLLDLGSQMGLEVWAPKRDRGRSWNSQTISQVPRLRDKLPAQFDENTNRTIEEIDVLWLTGQTIVAAFEVEHSTSIFSGLLRMSDLLTMQPNITINLYIVGPDERYTKFENEIARPTFAARARPLYSLCRFLSYSKLCQRLEEARNVVGFLRPEFLDDIAELYDPEEQVDA